MSAQALLDRLDKVKRIRPGAWKAVCPVHGDKRPSLYVTEQDNGIVLVNCISRGCGFHEIVAATGVDVAELFPPKPPRPEGYKPIKRPLYASDVFEDLRHECTVVALIGADLHKAKAVSQEDFERVWVAVGKLQRIGEAAYGR